MNRYSTLMLGLSLLLLVAAPWVAYNVRFPVYVIGVATLAAAVVFRFLND